MSFEHCAQGLVGTLSRFRTWLDGHGLVLFSELENAFFQQTRRRSPDSLLPELNDDLLGTEERGIDQDNCRFSCTAALEPAVGNTGRDQVRT